MVDGAALEKRCAKAPRVRIPPSPPRSTDLTAPGRVGACAPRSRTLGCARSGARRRLARNRHIDGTSWHGRRGTMDTCLSERSPSGLWRRTGNAVRGNPSRVRIPPSPPSPRRRGRPMRCVVASAPRSRTLECARSGARRRLRLDRPAARSPTRSAAAAASPRPAGPGILPRAVLGGELAVPCTCNPLQQG